MTPTVNKTEGKFKYLNVGVWDSKVEIGDEELPSSFHTSSSATPSSTIEAAEAVVKHVMLPFIWKLFRLQQTKENAPADFRIPLPLSITVHTAGCWGKQGLHFPQGQGAQLPQQGPPHVPCPPHHYKQVNQFRQDIHMTNNYNKGVLWISPLSIIIVYTLALRPNEVTNVLKLKYKNKVEEYVVCAIPNPPTISRITPEKLALLL